MALTVRDVIEFYSNKPDLTAEDKKGMDPKAWRILACGKASSAKKGYTKVAYIFEQAEKGEKLPEKTDDATFYTYLKRLCEEKNRDSNYVFDEGQESEVTAQVSIFDPFIRDTDGKYFTDNGKKIISQKWHLLVSLYAYLDAVNNKGILKGTGISSGADKRRAIDWEHETVSGESRWRLIENGSGYSCQALKLWMAMAAGVKSDELDKYMDDIAKLPWSVVENAIENDPWFRDRRKKQS